MNLVDGLKQYVGGFVDTGQDVPILVCSRYHVVGFKNDGTQIVFEHPCSCYKCKEEGYK